MVGGCGVWGAIHAPGTGCIGLCPCVCVCGVWVVVVSVRGVTSGMPWVYGMGLMQPITKGDIHGGGNDEWHFAFSI